jgi:hypothetical protein
MMHMPSQFVAGGKKEGQFWNVFWPSLTAMVGFWATLALNIPDFTRFARSQRDQLIGQTIGLPLPMGLLALMSVIVTSATVVIYGKAIWDPVDLSAKFTGIGVGFALLILTLDTMCVNLAANLVGPAYDFASLAPKRISYRTGGLMHRVHRAARDAVEDPREHAGLHLHLAGRIFRSARTGRRHHARRLLFSARHAARCRRTVRRARRILVSQAAGIRRPSIALAVRRAAEPAGISDAGVSGCVRRRADVVQELCIRMPGLPGWRSRRWSMRADAPSAPAAVARCVERHDTAEQTV